jgi:hypothetical protein
VSSCTKTRRNLEHKLTFDGYPGPPAARKAAHVRSTIVYARYRTVSALTRTIQVPPRPYDDVMSSFPFNVNL